MLERLVLGSTLNFATTVSGYSAADGWVLKFALVPRTGSSGALTLTSAADGEQHRVQVASTTTASWTAGVYSWYSWVEKGTEKYDVARGSTELVANPRTAPGPLDLRTEAQKALDAARAALAAWTPTQRRYRIAGREMEFAGTAEILKVVSYWEGQVAREENAARVQAGLASRRTIFLRLGRG